MSAARDKARFILGNIPKRDILSDTDAKLFVDLTNTSHATMKANWDAGGIMTACNGFTGTYSTKLGRPGLGVFDLKKASGAAWVPAGSGARPEYGDVFRMTKLHVGVFMEIGDAVWNVIEAGQGGKSVHHDIIRQSGKTFGPSDLMGWVNIDIYLDPHVMAGEAVKARLKGGWSVKTDGPKRNYSFPGTNEVFYVEKGKKVPGTWEADDKNVTIKWSNGMTEVWPLPLPPLYKPAEGTWSDTSGKSGTSTFTKGY